MQWDLYERDGKTAWCASEDREIDGKQCRAAVLLDEKDEALARKVIEAAFANPQ